VRAEWERIEAEGTDNIDMFTINATGGSDRRGSRLSSGMPLSCWWHGQRRDMRLPSLCAGAANQSSRRTTTVPSGCIMKCGDMIWTPIR